MMRRISLLRLIIKFIISIKDKKSECEIVLHTGSDINSTISTLQKVMKTVDIDLPVPNHLLQLAVK